MTGAALAALLEDHRAAYKHELAVKMTTAAVPSDTAPILVRGQYVDVVDAGPLGGAPFSVTFTRLLGHPEQYGQAYPWARALWMVRVECRRNHPHHRRADRPYWRGALCHQAIRLTVMLGKSPEQAARILRLPSLDELLCGESGRGGAFRILEDAIDAQRARAERRAREDAGRGDGAIPLPQHEHHKVPGLHETDCIQCRRNSAA